MLPFSTEFPVKPNQNRAAFIAEVIAWLRGTSYSDVIASNSDNELDDENVHLLSKSGEELRLRELSSENGSNAVGFRHDFPDGEGRLWRTEGVLGRSAVEEKSDLLRLRTQCIAQFPGVRLDTPRKPYLIKSLLKSGWGDTDALLTVSDKPFWLQDDEAGLQMARLVTLGDATRWLPSIYVSAIGAELWLLSQNEIEKLAYDLGGIAHVVVEPNRAFSFRLRDATEGRNAYGGTVGLSVPSQGVVRRYYLGWQIQDGRDLATAIRVAAANVRSQMPAFGWDWTELQEQALRAQRKRDKSRLSAEESEQLYVAEIENLQDKIRQLKQQLGSHPVDSIGTDDAEFSTDNLVGSIGPEVYSGEISDRLRFSARTTLSVADQIGLDARSHTILQRIVDRLPVSPALGELSQDLARATTDRKRVAKELISLLERHGYSEKSDNKHIRLEANKGYDGLDAITLPKTPSENRGLKNLRKQIERTLGLTKLS